MPLHIFRCKGILDLILDSANIQREFQLPLNEDSFKVVDKMRYREEEQRISPRGIALILFAFFIMVMLGVSLSEYNSNLLLGIDAPVKAVRFRQPEPATYCITVLGDEYNLRKVIEYGRLDLSRDQICFTGLNRTIVIPLRIEVASVEKLIGFFNSLPLSCENK
jgi:hypothetical protein